MMAEMRLQIKGKDYLSLLHVKNKAYPLLPTYPSYSKAEQMQSNIRDWEKTSNFYRKYSRPRAGTQKMETGKAKQALGRNLM